LKEQRALSAEQAKQVQDLQAERDRLSQANTKWTEQQRSRYKILREEKKSWEGERRGLVVKIAELEVSTLIPRERLVLMMTFLLFQESLAVKSRANAVIERT
jgi:hypothetical protein